MRRWFRERCGAAHRAPTKTSDTPSTPSDTPDERDGPPVTRFTLRVPEGAPPFPGAAPSPNTPGTRLDNPVVCEETFGYSTPAFWATNDSSLWEEWRDNNEDTDGTGDLGHLFDETFRQWVELCPVSDAEAGDYILQVETNTLGEGEGGGGGGNRFSIRARAEGAAGNTDVQVAADGRLTLSADVASGNDFFVTEVTSSPSDRVLELTFYDPADLAVCDDLDDAGSCERAPAAVEGGMIIGRDNGAGSVVPFTECYVWRPTVETKPSVPGSCDIDLDASRKRAPPANGHPARRQHVADWLRLQRARRLRLLGEAEFWFPPTIGTQHVRPSDVTTWTASVGEETIRIIE